MRALTLLVPLLLFATQPQISPAQSVRDISPDGSDTASVGSIMAPVSLASDSVPFRYVPDWNCNLRMQVGGLNVGDLNNDSLPDVAVACYRSQSYPPYPDWRDFVLYNEGGELQSAPGWWPRDSVSSTEVRIADFNNDGRTDLFCAHGDGSFPPDAIYFGTPGETLHTTPGWRAGNSTWTTGAAVADFDRDGDLDVATSNQGVSPDPYRQVSIFRNSNGVLEQIPSWTSLVNEISSAIAWGDMNGDGYPELAVSKWVNFRSTVYLNDSGSVVHAPAWTGNTTQGQKGIGWADLNGDGLNDIAVGGSIPTQVYRNSGGVLEPAPVWSSTNASHGTQDLAWGDVDGDGDPDLATAEFSTGHFRIYLNRNGQLDQSPSWQFDSPSVGTALAFGDINGDGRIDLVIGVSGQPCVSVFYNTLITGVADVGVPETQVLLQNYPNPFNPSTTLAFRLGEPSVVTLRVFDVLGQEVHALLMNERLGAGLHTVVFEPRSAVSGMYLARLSAASETRTHPIGTRKMLLLK